MKKAAFSILLALCVSPSWAQSESETAYNFLRLPVGAHAAAIGGDNVSLVEDDENLLFNNPALLSSSTPKTIALNYMSYMQGVKAASAAFNWASGERATWAVGAQYLDYGKMKQTDENNIQTGDFSARDIAVSGTLAYMLTDKIAGGITTRLIASYIGDYNSIGFGVDLGLNYYDDDRQLSVSLTAKNLGGQLKAYDENYEKMPFDLQAGVTKGLSSFPLRLSLTLVDLNHPHYKLLNHVVVGGDFLIGDNLWLGMGYNFRRADEMKISDGDKDSSHGAGLSLGAGLDLNRLKIGVSYGKYHVSSSSLIFSAAFSL